MPNRDIIVIGASAGGQEALTRLVQGLPAGLPAALFVVRHTLEESHSLLPEILSRNGRLLASHARDGDPIRYGHITVAPPDFHMLLEDGRVRLARGPRENGSRPAIDPLFRSAAHVYGARVVGVVLSGLLRDGTAGLLAIRGAGGAAVIQDPDEALMPDMPRLARDIAGADHILPASAMAPLLARLVREPVAAEGGFAVPDPLEQMPGRVQEDMAAQERDGRRGQLSVFTCPECGGSLWQVDQKELARFRCHTGHVYYAEKLLEEQSGALEAALWTAVRTFKEKTILARQLAVRERRVGNEQAAVRFEDEANVAERYGLLIQQHILHAGDGQAVPPTPAVGETNGPTT